METNRPDHPLDETPPNTPADPNPPGQPPTSDPEDDTNPGGGDPQGPGK